jgi:hypothetical protein
VVTDGLERLRRQQPPRPLDEHRRRLASRAWGVGGLDHRLGAGQRVAQPVAADEIDRVVGGPGHWGVRRPAREHAHIVPAPGELRDHLPAEHARSSCYRDVHRRSPFRVREALERWTTQALRM